MTISELYELSISSSLFLNGSTATYDAENPFIGTELSVLKRTSSESVIEMMSCGSCNAQEGGRQHESDNELS